MKLDKFAIVVASMAALMPAVEASAAAAVAASLDGPASVYTDLELSKKDVSYHVMSRCTLILKPGQRPCKMLGAYDVPAAANGWALSKEGKILGTVSGFGYSIAEAEAAATKQCQKFSGLVECQIGTSHVATPRHQPSTPQHAGVSGNHGHGNDHLPLCSHIEEQYVKTEDDQLTLRTPGACAR